MSLYLVAKLKVKYGHMAEAAAVLKDFFPHLQQQGWKLLGSYHPVIGDFTEIIDIWEVPEANAVTNAIMAMAGNAAWEKNMAAFREHVESEHLSVCAKFPFSP